VASQIVLLAFAVLVVVLYVVPVVVRTRQRARGREVASLDYAARRTFLLASLAVCFVVLGIIGLVQGDTAGGLVALALAGIEGGIVLLIHRSRPAPPSLGS
jgi:predicted membrane-bound spermidine synthase